MSQTVINPKAINTKPITIDRSGDSALETRSVVLQQQGEPFEFGRECAVVKVIDPLDEAVASLDRWAVVPNDVQTRFEIGQLHSCGLLVGSSLMRTGFIRLRSSTQFNQP